MARRLVLWDVDGTLLRTAAGADVFDVAVERVLGRHPGDHGTRMSGKTDPQIALEILAFADVREEAAAAQLPRVVEHLEAALAEQIERIRTEGSVLPGVGALLDLLQADPDVHCSLLTGNTAANAAVKVEALQLASRLDLEIGAYGSDDADRRALVPIALERARRLRGLDLAPEAVWVVGDTPLDLACARAGGARCVLVATGRYDADELREAGPDAVFDDLRDVEAVADVLRS